MAPSLRTTLVTGLALVMAVAVHAQIPSTMSYQGVLVEDDGPGTGPIQVTFRLFDQPTGGIALWSETHASVPVTAEGIFSLTLGSITPIPASFDRQYWLEVVVDGTTSTPRAPLASSPYAMRAKIADGVRPGTVDVASLDVSGAAPADGQVLTFNQTAGGLTWRTPSTSGGGGGITSIVGTGAIGVQNGAGPVTTLSIRSESIDGTMIADGSITQADLDPNIGLPLLGAAGGDLAGEYPNPQIAAGTITGSDVSSQADLTIRSVDAAEFVQSTFAGSDTLHVGDHAAIGTGVSATTRLLVQGVGTTSATAALDVRNLTGASVLTALDNGNVGIGVPAPTSALQIGRAGGLAFQVVAGSVAFSTAVVGAGPTIPVPPGATLVEVTNDGLAAPNLLIMPPGTPGQMIVVYNSDANPITFGVITVAPGTAGIFMFLPATAAWARVN